MSQSTTTVSENKAPPQGKSLLPPEERFWKRYSPHNEFPLSTAGSVALHLLVGGLLVLGGWLLVKLGWTSKTKPLPIDAIVVAGGGGNPKGIGDGPGDGAIDPREAVDAPKADKPKPGDKVERPDLKAPDKPVPIDTPDPKDKAHIQRLIDRAGEAGKTADALVKETEKLFHGLTPAGKGQGGSGSGGGKGMGDGPGQGPGKGPGKGELNVRQMRVLRWDMRVETLNGEDYLRKLKGLKAIIAVPDPEKPEHYQTLDLAAQGSKWQMHENLAHINRIFWLDKNPRSVDDLGQALRLKARPPFFYAFLPEKLEEDMKDMELAFARSRYKNPKIEEADIEYTKFVLTEPRSNVFVPKVESSRLVGR